MLLDASLIKEKIERIDTYINRIGNMDLSEAEFVENIDYQDLLTFRLQQAVETAIDIATHIIAAQKLEKPDTARSSFEVLSNAKIISRELAQRLAYAVSFRNLAVHGYDKFDFKQLFHDYKKDVDDLKQFVTAILDYLKNIG